MDIDSLSLLLSVARRGSFAATAKERGADPSAVSRSIAAIEAELGVRLFQRSTRRLNLTEAGEVYLARIEPLMDELAGAAAEARSLSTEPSGRLRLTASVTFGQMVVLPLLKPFRQRYPMVSIDGIFTDANLDLVAERIDLAIRLAPAADGDLVATKLMDTRYRVVASPDYLASGPPLECPSDLSAHSCLLFDLPGFRSHWQFRDAAGAIESVAIHGDITLSPAGSLRDAALAGLGPALLPDWLVGADVTGGRLVDLFPVHAAAATSFDTAAWLLYPSRAFLPDKVRVMIDFLRASLRRGLPR